MSKKTFAGVLPGPSSAGSPAKNRMARWWVTAALKSAVLVIPAAIRSAALPWSGALMAAPMSIVTKQYCRTCRPAYCLFFTFKRINKMKKLLQNASALGKQAQREIRGGAWPSLRSFTCRRPNGVIIGSGCTQTAGWALTCCGSPYSGYSLVWGAYGCPVQVCNN